MEDNKNLEYDGNCAFALSLGKSPEVTTGKHTYTKNGKIYAFMNPVAKFLFKLFPKSIDKADANWKNK